ncbi:DNA repair protein [Helicobacter burdigaliensis]|uniref:DNA repair protein n=1 Tax=Helicobacter burdigaliensis TaxID=2315334 RepID=UPI000EF68316|nr:DNA repair protein [Helicobacter burdigaliensis]
MQELIIHKILIKNSLSFKEECFEPSKHFNVISGASGAGKSVLMQSILALFGLKEANAELIEATLSIKGIGEDFIGLVDEGELILTLSKKDKVRYFLGGQNIPKKRIQELFEPFLKHLGAKGDLESEDILRALDGMILGYEKGFLKQIKKYEESFLKYQASKAQLKELQEKSLKVNELKEFVAFEIKKLEELSPKKGEYEELLELKKQISKKEKIAQSLNEVMQILSQSHKIASFLTLINKENESILNAFNELESLCEQEGNYLEELEESNIEEILNRIEALSALKHRYGGVEEALEYLDKKKKELQEYENLDNLLKEAQNCFKKNQEELDKEAKELSSMRLKYLEKFSKILNQTLELLKMPNACVDLQEVDFMQSGKDMCNLSFHNKTSIKNLSSGEFNRLRLALLLTKGKEAKNEAIILLDEVDANLSGEESSGVAEILKRLSNNYQIFAISHQPHMPSLADKHYLVQKQKEGSKIIELDKKGRIEEIARMISGKEITKEALEFATKALKV